MKPVDAMLKALPIARVTSAMLAATSEKVLGSPRFEPLRVLGEGGSGIVYEVRIRSGIDAGRQTVALKVLRAELAPSERERRRFLEEAERMQRLDAPGLVKLLEAGLLPDGRPYLAMPLLDGETLAARLRRGPLPASTAIRYFGILARAVHALHAAGMVHRDVKPENVMIVDDAPVLLDFGIARDIDDDTTTTTAEGRVRGTPAYMAPERFFGVGASVRSDVYELGVVLYTMLVGRLPWGSEKSVTDRLNPASPRDAGADVSSALATVILRALSTRPEMRPSSAEELANEVGAAAAEAAAPSRRTLDVEMQEPLPVTERPAAARSMPPPPAITVRLVAAVALITAVAGGTAWAIGRSTAPSIAPAATVTASMGVIAAPTSCAAGPVPSSVPSIAPAAAAMPTATPSASAAPALAPSLALAPSARVPSKPRPSAAPSASATDPSRYFEDRK